MDGHAHPDRRWLKAIKPKDAIGVLEERAVRVAKIIDRLERDKGLPHTIGLFGTWGSGKTATVAYIADELESRGHHTVYFNAYKYASYMEVVPALIYRLIDALPINNDSAASERLVKIMSTLSGKYADRFGTWLESKIGVDLVEASKDVKNILEAPEAARQKLLQEYYTRVDRAQDTLVDVFGQSNLDKPVVVLIDELDRCDPGEAFEAMKQLRILFNMRGLNIVFVLVANPYPIGLAIRHQFGLDESKEEI
jgi:Cdc6-like AAA superfamily ATPase